MSSQEDNTHNRKLKELLDKNKSSENLPADDFEQEALEGFAMLDSTEESLDLKKNLDSRIYTEVFTEEKKSKKVFWYAAAGLMLIIGLSVYFIKNNPVSKNEDLAVHSQTMNVDEIQKSLEDQTKKNKDLEFKQAENPGEKQWAKENQPEAKSKSDASINANKNLPVELNSDDKNISFGAMSEENKPQGAPALAEVQDKKEAQLQDETYSTNESEKDIASDKERVVKISNSKAKKNVAISDVEIKKYNAPVERKKSGNREEVVSAGAPSPAAEAVSKNCFYSGGEAVLIKDLKNLLSAKNISQKFDATLYINENWKVEKAELTNSYDLDKSQQKEVIEILKKLDKFNVVGVTGKSLAEYKVVFRP